MSEAPALSVVVPVYNGAATIGELVNALRALKIADGLEIVLVVDGSPDNSLAVCKQLPQRFKRGLEPEIDFVIDAGFFPVPLGDGGVFGIHIAGDHPAVGGKGQRHDQGAITGEHAHLERAFRAHQVHQ